MTDKKVKELANEILEYHFSDYADFDINPLVEMIRKYIPKDTVLVNLDQYRKWQYEMCEMKREIVRLNQTITPAKIRKETAKEILQGIKEKAWAYSKDEDEKVWNWEITQTDLDEIANQYGLNKHYLEKSTRLKQPLIELSSHTKCQPTKTKAICTFVLVAAKIVLY